MAAQPQRWPIVAGDIVTTGTITDAAPLAPGQRWQTRLSDPRLAGMTLRHDRMTGRRATQALESRPRQRPAEAPDRRGGRVVECARLEIWFTVSP